MLWGEPTRCDRINVTCGRKGGVLAESPEAPSRWSLGYKVLLGSNMCKGKRRRARLSRGRSLRPQSLDQSEGALEGRLLLSVPCQAEKPGLLPLSYWKPSNTEGSDSQGPTCCPHCPQLGKSCLAGEWAVHLCVCHRSLQGVVLFWQLDGWIFISYDGWSQFWEEAQKLKLYFQHSSMMSGIISYPSETCSCSVGATLGST